MQGCAECQAHAKALVHAKLALHDVQVVISHVDISMQLHKPLVMVRDEVSTQFNVMNTGTWQV